MHGTPLHAFLKRRNDGLIHDLEMANAVGARRVTASKDEVIGNSKHRPATDGKEAL